MSAFLDTNVVVYAFDQADPSKAQVAIDLLESDQRLVISTQVLLETWWVLTRKLSQPMDEDTAWQVIQSLSELPVVQTDVFLVHRGIATSRRWQISIWDAMILEAACSSGCDRVVTEDLSHGQRYGDVVVENPFL